MESPPQSQIEADLRKQRESVRRGLARVQAAIGVVLCLVAALALAAIAQTWRVERKSGEARRATERTEEELWRSRLLQARSERASGLVGRRDAALASIAAAAAFRPSQELRDEAVAALALVDLAETPASVKLPWTPILTAVDPELQYYASAGGVGQLQIGRIAGGEAQAQALDTHGAEAHVLEFSPDGKKLAWRSSAGLLEVWDVAAGKCLLTRDFAAGEPYGSSVSFSPDSSILAASGPDAAVHFFPVSHEGEVRAGWKLAAAPAGVRWDESGRRLAVWFSVNNEIQILDYPSGRVAQTFELPALPTKAVWEPNDARLAVGCVNGIAYLADVKTGRQRELRGHSDLISSVGFHPRADLLFSQSWDGTTRFWDTDTAETLFTMADKTPVAFSADGQKLAGIDRRRGALVIWRVAGLSDFCTLRRAPEGGRVWSAAFSDNGQWLAAGTDAGVELWDLPAKRLRAVTPGGATFSVAFDRSSSNLLAAGQDGVVRWSVGRDANLARAERMDLGGDAALPVRALWGPDGGVVALTRERAHFLARDKKEADRVIPMAGNMNVMALDQGARWLVAGTWIGEGTRVWDAHSGQSFRKLDNADACVQFTPDGRGLITGSGREYVMWDTNNWTRRWSVPRTTTGVNIGPIAFDGAGSVLAVAPSTRLTQLIHPEDGSPMVTLTAPNARQILSFALARDASALAVGTANGGVQLWNVAHLRADLAGLGLDWPFPAGRAPSLPAQEPSFGPGLFFAMFGVVAAAWATYALVFRRFRQLIENYQQIENTALARGRDLIAAQTEIIHSQKMKALGALAAGIAHDFNNLLSVIRMANKSIARSVSSEQEIRQDLADIEDAALQGKQIVRSMVGFSREIPGESKQCVVADVVEDTIKLMSKPFLGGLQLTLELDRALPAATVSRSRLAQILLNLMMNAAEAMQGRGELVLTVRAGLLAPDTQRILRPRQERGLVELIVADTGPGIPAAVLQRIFEPFFTTKTTGAARGSGLGLSVAYAMAEHEGIGIAVDTVPGQGTRFHLLLPTS